MLFQETGLYYLQSRYYNPAYGRFLNADDTDILEVTKGTIHGANLFAYCNNNPVMNVDYCGGITLEVISMVLLTVVGVYFLYLFFSTFIMVLQTVVSQPIDTANIWSVFEGIINLIKSSDVLLVTLYISLVSAVGEHVLNTKG